MMSKSNVLLVGCGGIGTISALNLQCGGRATVTAVLRSNYGYVQSHGFHIRSIDHGVVEAFRPDTVRNTIPDVAKEELQPYKFIVCTTKNVPDVSPTLADLIRPAITPGYSVVVLIQNGLNIEKPIISAFPQNIVLSGISFCGSHEVSQGHIVHEDNDEVFIGAFHNPALDSEQQANAAKEFVEIYGAGGKCLPEYKADVGWTRWRKLLYNACLNPTCAITDLDSGRIQLADGVVEGLVRPAMQEIRAAAKACGHDLPEELVDAMITMDPVTMYNPPSMQVDIRKGRYCEFENLLGEPLKEGRTRGVPMPTVAVLYSILKGIQWRTKERNGLIPIPAPEDHTVKHILNTYTSPANRRGYPRGFNPSHSSFEPSPSGSKRTFEDAFPSGSVYASEFSRLYLIRYQMEALAHNNAANGRQMFNQDFWYDDADRSLYPQFRYKLQTKFFIDGNAIGDEERRVCVAFGYLRDSAAAVILPWMEATGGTPAFTFGNFLQALDTAFADSARQEKALNRLNSLKQGKRSFEDLANEVDRLILESGGITLADSAAV